MSPTSSASPQAPPAAGTGDSAAAAAQSPAVHTIDLRKRYHATVALDGLSMTVARGEVFGFLGPNGAGKTTAVRLLLGLARPTSGEAMVLGAPAGDLETRRKIGYLPELFRYQSWLTAREVLILHCRLLRIPRPRRAGEVAGALETVGLAARADDRVGTFSKGMQQRLGLGVALLGEPGADRPGRAHQRPRPGRAASGPDDHPGAARPGRHRLPEHSSAGGSRTGLRPGDGTR